MKYFFGKNQKFNYFEGWYFKQVSDSLNIAFIPSISIISPKEKYCYVQVISEFFTHRFEFPYEQFHAETNRLLININKNLFSEDGLKLNLKDDFYHIEVDLKFSKFVKLKNDIMGPFKNLPFMECKHNVFSMKHFVNGQVKINNQEFFYNQDWGYIEGDYGHSFPDKYIWVEANDSVESSFFLSIATIPYSKIKFQGLICSLINKNKEYRFATYNLSKILINEKNHLKIKKGKYILDLFINDSSQLKLSAPKNGIMTREVFESMKGSIKVILLKNNQTIFNETFKNASIEIG